MESDHQHPGSINYEQKIIRGIRRLLENGPRDPRTLIELFSYSPEYGNLRETAVRDILCSLIASNKIEFDRHYNLQLS